MPGYLCPLGIYALWVFMPSGCDRAGSVSFKILKVASSPKTHHSMDWTDVSAFKEVTSDSYGIHDKKFDASLPATQSQLRIAELVKTFYGLVINWLRVRRKR